MPGHESLQSIEPLQLLRGAAGGPAGDQAIRAHFAQAQLTSAQFSILVALTEEGRMTMLDLAKVLVMDRTTLLRAMKPLQREDLLKSAASDADPRQLVFWLSPAGERKLKQAMPLWTKAQEEFEAGMGPREAARLRTRCWRSPRTADHFFGSICAYALNIRRR